MLQWDHSGFSVDGSVRIPAGSSRTREALSQYIARAPLSLNKMVVEDHAGTVLYHTAYNPYFRTNRKLFRATDFIAELLQHLPDLVAFQADPQKYWDFLAGTRKT